MRRGQNSARAEVLLAALLALALAALAGAPTAGADAISPEAGPTENAVDTDTLYKIVFGFGLAMIALVWGLLFYSLFRYRARRGRVAPQIRGNTPLELGWTAGATALVIILTVITLFMLDDIKDPLPSGTEGLAEASRQNAVANQPPPPGGEGLPIKVTGQQFLWRYQYPNGAVSFHDLVAPKDTTVTLEITSNDVAHSWWIPKLGPKFDALRGYTNETWFKATETGTFEGQCAELCGDNHAFMTAKVIVVEPDRYQQWVEQQKRLIEEAQQAAQRQRRQIQSQAQGDGGGGPGPEREAPPARGGARDTGL
jgi:cytochrome c oxidase subunit 2